MNGDTATQPQSAVPQVNVLPQPQAPNTAGMTQISPDLTPRQQPRQTWSARGLPAIALSIVGQVQKRKQRETEQVVGQFVSNYKGIEEAKSQLQQLQQQNMKLAQAFQAAQTPEEKQQIQQQIQQSVQQARELMSKAETNRQNLREMFNGKNQEKHAKIISKAFGIDDKNAGTPERQAAIKVIQDQMKVDQKTASMVSRLPQRQQLSPEARAQQQLVQGGIQGRPLTAYQAGELANAQRKLEEQRREKIAMLDRIDPQLRLAGKTFDRDANGEIKFGPNGQPIVRMMTKEEVQQAQSMKPSASKPMKPTISNGMLVGITNPADGKLYTSPKDAPEEVQKAWKDITHQLDTAFNRQIFKMQTAFSNAILRGDYMMAKREVDKTNATYEDSLDRMAVMDKNLPEGLNGNQQAMVSMVANHIGMTLGLQRGARITQTVWNEAVATAPWMARISAHFDSDGYLSGVVLTPEQMHQMVDLAHDRVDVMKDHVARVKEQYESELSVRPEPKKKPESKSAAPPPRAGGGKTVEELEKTHEWRNGPSGWGWYKKQTK